MELVASFVAIGAECWRREAVVRDRRAARVGVEPGDRHVLLIRSLRLKRIADDVDAIVVLSGEADVLIGVNGEGLTGKAVIQLFSRHPPRSCLNEFGDGTG